MPKIRRSVTREVTPIYQLISNNHTLFQICSNIKESQDIMNMIVGSARYLNFFKKETKLVPYWIIQKYPLTLKTVFKPSFLEIT